MSVTAVFVGMPGSGKTTVGKIVARYLGEPFADTDMLIEKEMGMSIPEIFKKRGEAGFRSLEAEVVARALSERTGVLSLGGGAVLAPSTRHALAGFRVVLIDVERDVLLSRLARSTNDRPLMRGDTAAKLDALLVEREPLYRECATDIVRSDGAAARRVARRVLAVLGHARHTHVEAGSLDAIIGTGLAEEAFVATERATGVVVLHSGEIPASYRAALSGRRTIEHRVGPTLDNAAVEDIRSFLDRHCIARSAAVLAVGDAPMLQLCAFATRGHAGGLRLVAVPTTLEGALDGAWKACHPDREENLPFVPEEILCDLDVLAPDDAGMACALSLGFARSSELLALATRSADHGSGRLARILEIGIAARAQGAHAHQRGEEFFYGHTVSQALRRLRPPADRAESLAAGMLFAAGLAEGLGIAEDGWLAAHKEALRAAGLPEAPFGPTRRELEEAIETRAKLMAPDPKTYRHFNRFLVLSGPAMPRVVNSVDGSALDAGFRAIGL